MEARHPANTWALQIARRLWADFMAREPGTLRGEDVEQLHRMRVAHRRLRTALGSFAPVLPPDLVAADDELQWIGRSLGEVRDLDVQLEAMSAAGVSLDAPPNAMNALIEAVASQRDQARNVMLEALTSDRFERLVLQIARSLRPQVTPEQEGRSATVEALAPPMLKERYRQFRKAARRLRLKSPPAEYHQARRRARRLRFSAEFVEEIYGVPASELIEAVTELQDLFGAHQDCYAAIALRRRVSSSLPEQAVGAAAALDARDLERAAQLRKSAPDAIRRVRKRWKALEKAMKK
jgi:CHAD domain-containing protein